MTKREKTLVNSDVLTYEHMFSATWGQQRHVKCKFIILSLSMEARFRHKKKEKRKEGSY